MPIIFSLKLIDASKDAAELFQKERSSESKHLITSKHDRGLYYAHRFFNFLKSIPELRSAVRDESSLESMAYI